MTNLDNSLRFRTDPAPAASRDREMLVHDLRCAMQFLSGSAAVMGVQEGLDADLRLQLARIGETVRHVAELVGALVGDRPVADEESGTDLQELFGRIDLIWSGEATGRGQRLVIDLAPELPGRVAVDPASLLRILGNLICNALKHSHSDQVELSARADGVGGLEIAVRDRGLGLAETRIADLRARGPVVPNAEGHGLGLGIARDLCIEIGGDFRIANRPGGGLEATLLIPSGLCGAVERNETNAAPARARALLSGRHVLLAEDNQTNQLVATQMLRALDAEVTLASDGVEALERFELGDFDLVIVDIEMPRLSGLDVIRAVRARKDARAAIPIVALTAYAMREHRDRIAAAGANGLISKPLTSIEALGEALGAHLGPVEEPAATTEPAPPAAADSGEPVADQAVFEALRRAIGADMMGELLEKVIADLRQAHADLGAALAPLDRKSIRSASHILISVAGAIGAVRLQHCARALNTAAHSDSEPGLPDQVRRCMEEIDAAVAFADGQRQAA